MDAKEREEIQTKGIDNLFNRMIAENFPNLDKESHQVQEAYRMPNQQDQKKKSPKTHHNQNIQHPEQRKNSESCKGEKTSHIQS
jgi:hypothetical protein